MNEASRFINGVQKLVREYQRVWEVRLLPHPPTPPTLLDFSLVRNPGYCTCVGSAKMPCSVSFSSYALRLSTQMLLKTAIFTLVFSDRGLRSRYSNATHSEE
ncbi:hypothetical protein FD723_15480 [Nostoc sp. C052]|uniref:hypothetical protein n=1 Tax=Nostoc sp. C052 TaxID=2576902 RepID=UPI0015C2EE3F|nr:hypothetical protein [Nostoc sp. C052]QLE41678.1 hypothetical protein FD723_15480 [Nostoc sp. C052]